MTEFSTRQGAHEILQIMLQKWHDKPHLLRNQAPQHTAGAGAPGVQFTTDRPQFRTVKIFK